MVNSSSSPLPGPRVYQPRPRAWPPRWARLGLGVALAVWMAWQWRAWVDRSPRRGAGPPMSQWPHDPRADALRRDLEAAAPPPLSGLSPSHPNPPPPTRPPGFMRGIALGMFSKNPGFSYGFLIDEIAAERADWVSLVIPYHQRDGAATEMAPAMTDRELETALVNATAWAHGRGLKVLLFPVVLLSAPAEGEWRGNLHPRDRAAWFANYHRRIEELALLGRANGVDAFCVGSELASLEGETEAWGKLIDACRVAFPSPARPLIYSANWDHYEEIPFWERLDAVGLSGYFELTRTTTPSIESIQGEWERIGRRILDWRARRGLAQPIVFTEIGYPNQDGASMYPWDYTRRAPPDPAEQALCLEGFIRAWHGRPELGGVFFYNWFGFADLKDTGYSPRGKPAAETIRVWYDALAR